MAARTEAAAGEPATAADLRQRRYGIAAAITCIAVVGFGVSLSTPLLSLWMEARGVSETWIGLNTAVAGLAALAAAPLVSPLIRRTGTPVLLHLALAIAAASFALFPVTPFWAWFPLRFVFSGALTCLFVVSEFWINAVAPDQRRGLVLGIYAAVLSTTYAAGPALLALVGSDSPIALAAPLAALAIAALPVALARAAAPARATPCCACSCWRRRPCLPPLLWAQPRRWSLPSCPSTACSTG